MAQAHGALSRAGPAASLMDLAIIADENKKKAAGVP